MRAYFQQHFRQPGTNALGIRQHLVVPEPDHPPTLSFQPRSALPILFAIRMLTAIDLNGEFLLETGQIQDKRTDRMLAAEFVAIQLPCSQQRPEPMFGIRHRSA